jgi:hypothetical protein
MIQVIHWYEWQLTFFCRRTLVCLSNFFFFVYFYIEAEAGA